MEVQASLSNNTQLKVHIDVLPDSCPFCKKRSIPAVRYALLDDPSQSPRELQVVVQCPNAQCRRLFIGRYMVREEFNPLLIVYYGLLVSAKTLVHAVNRTFSHHVRNVSPSFCDIYREAEIADANGLRLICGAGYRKALEFLIKDFIINHLLADHPAEHEKVRNAFLGTCIATYIDDPHIRAAAERAAWLGNDETHYIRRWQDKDLSDLKKLINMTVSWIELVLESSAYQKAMPDSKSDS